MPPSARVRSRRCVALVCSAALLLAACHKSSKTVSSTTGTPSTNAKGHIAVTLGLKIGTLKVEAAGAPRPFDLKIGAGILVIVNHYIKTAIATPLLTGKPASGLAGYFAPALASRIGVKGKDRPALTDEKEPVLTDVTKQIRQPLNLVALQNRGATVMIGGSFALGVQGNTDQGPLNVSRVGNFIFEPDSHHVWHITGYTIIVRRTTGSTTTTTKATTTTAAK